MNRDKEDQQDDWAKMMDELEAWIQADEGTPEMVDMLNWEPPGKEKETKCECGSDKVGSPFHSKWCPKHEK